MGNLKSKATGKSSNSALKVKAGAKSIEPGAPPQSSGPVEAMPAPNLAFNSAPPLPPAFAYLKQIASIPGLRKRGVPTESMGK